MATRVRIESRKCLSDIWIARGAAARQRDSFPLLRILTRRVQPFFDLVSCQPVYVMTDPLINGGAFLALDTIAKPQDRKEREFLPMYSVRLFAFYYTSIKCRFLVSVSLRLVTPNVKKIKEKSLTKRRFPFKLFYKRERKMRKIERKTEK